MVRLGIFDDSPLRRARESDGERWGEEVASGDAPTKGRSAAGPARASEPRELKSWKRPFLNILHALHRRDTLNALHRSDGS